MASTTKKYLDLNGLKYVLSKLAHTDSGTGVVTGLSQANGVIDVTKSLVTSDLLGADLKADIVKSVALSSETSGNTTTITLTPTLLNGNEGSATTATVTIPAATVTGASGFLKLDGTNVVLDTTKVQGATAESIDPASSTKLASKLYVDEAAKKAADNAIAKAVVYKGAVEALPAEGMANGDMYKMTVAISTPVVAKAGDTVIYNSDTSSWDVIPSGNDIEYTGIKVGDTVVVDATVGGDANFAAGDGIDVTGASGTVTIAHKAAATDQSSQASDLYKVSVDKFGHVTLGDKVDVDSIAAGKINALDANVTTVDATADGTDANTATTTTFYNVKQTDGLIAQDNANTVIFQTITATEIDALFTA